MTMSDDVKITVLREKLRRRAHSLRGEIRGKLGEAADDAQEGRGSTDTGEKSFAAAESLLDLAEAGRDIGELAAIDRALDAMEGGRYGRCEACGIDIEPGRLRAQPLALLCVDCQARSESRTGERHHSL